MYPHIFAPCKDTGFLRPEVLLSAILARAVKIIRIMSLEGTQMKESARFKSRLIKIEQTEALNPRPLTMPCV